MISSILKGNGIWEFFNNRLLFPWYTKWLQIQELSQFLVIFVVNWLSRWSFKSQNMSGRYVNRWFQSLLRMVLDWLGQNSSQDGVDGCSTTGTLSNLSNYNIPILITSNKDVHRSEASANIRSHRCVCVCVCVILVASWSKLVSWCCTGSLKWWVRRKRTRIFVLYQSNFLE